MTLHILKNYIEIYITIMDAIDLCQSIIVYKARGVKMSGVVFTGRTSARVGVPVGTRVCLDIYINSFCISTN